MVVNQCIVIDKFDFLLAHLDCDCIAESNTTDSLIKIIAFAESKEENTELKEYFYRNNYSGKYKILKGINSKEVNSID